MKHPAQPILLVDHPSSDRVLPLSGVLEEKGSGEQEEKGSGNSKAASFAAREDRGDLCRKEEPSPNNAESSGSVQEEKAASPPHAPH